MQHKTRKPMQRKLCVEKKAVSTNCKKDKVIKYYKVAKAGNSINSLVLTFFFHAKWANVVLLAFSESLDLFGSFSIKRKRT